MFNKLYKVNGSVVAVKEINGYDVNIQVKQGTALTVAEAVAVVAKAVSDGLPVAPWEFTSLNIKAKITVVERKSGAKEIFINSVDGDGYTEKAGHFHELFSMYTPK